MKHVITWLLLVVSCFGYTTVKTSSSNTVNTSKTTTQANSYPSYDFFWDMEADNVNYPIRSIASTPQSVILNTAEFYPGSGVPARSTNYAYSGSYSLRMPSVTTFPQMNTYNDGNTNVFATPRKGQVDFRFLFPTWVGSAMIYQTSGKTTRDKPTDPMATDDAIAILTVTGTTGTISLKSTLDSGSAQTFTVNPVSAWAAAPTWHHLTLRWDYDGLRSFTFYHDSDPPYITTTALTRQNWNAIHDVIIGNDTVTAFEFYLDDFTVKNPSQYAYDLPVTVWQDFEFTTVDQASLEANDHNPTLSWSLTGTTSRFTTQTAGQQTSPSTINLNTDTGTRGLRNDLNSTASGSIGVLFTGTTQAITCGGWVKSANLSASSVIRIITLSDNPAVNMILSLAQRDTAGQEEFILTNGSGGSSSSAVNISADTWYWVSISAIRNGTSKLSVYNTSGTQVGSEVTVVADNRSIGSVRIGSLSSTTSQTAGTYHYVDNLVYDQYAVYPLKPWQ